MAMLNVDQKMKIVKKKFEQYTSSGATIQAKEFNNSQPTFGQENKGLKSYLFLLT